MGDQLDMFRAQRAPGRTESPDIVVRCACHCHDLMALTVRCPECGCKPRKPPTGQLAELPGESFEDIFGDAA